MQMNYETNRLKIKILPETASELVLKFYLENKEVFEEYESDRPKRFYTEEYQRALLRCEYNLAVKQSSVRFWVFEKEQEDRVIGTFSFQDIRRSVYQSCELGYKFDKNIWGHGYAQESIAKGIQIMLEECRLHRIEAIVLPENRRSTRLLQSLGFESEGIRRQCVKLHGTWQDHEVYSLIANSDNGTSIRIPRF